MNTVFFNKKITWNSFWDKEIQKIRIFVLLIFNSRNTELL